MNNNYFLERDKKCTEKTARYLEGLPEFCFEYIMELENYTSSLTRMNYALDLRLFFDFISRYKFAVKPIDITYSHIEKISASDIMSFLSYLSFYNYNGKNYKNNERGKSRKLSSIRSLFKWLFSQDRIKSDVAIKVATPKLHEKEIVRLEVDEVSKILNLTETGDLMTAKQKDFNKHTKARDTAMLSLFLATGIRVSECVGLNINDFDFESNAFKITRKGGNQTVLYFSDEVKNALLHWIDVRSERKLPEGELAMFVSLQNRRITVRAVENLVKKYAKIISPLKKISPHKLRSTFGTNLYRETGDIYMVAEVLGHKDVNTTKKHYAAMSEDIRKSMANVIKLRDKEKNQTNV